VGGIVTNLYDDIDDAWRYECDYSSYKDDLPLILELSEEAQGPVLELGAGTGRVAIPLARRGIRVTALESSSGMTDLLEKKLASEDPNARKNLKIIKGNMSTAHFDTRFSLIILSFNFLQLITSRRERIELLRQCRHSLVNRGRLYIEVAFPHEDYICGGRVKRKYIKTFYDRNRRQWVVLFQSHEYLAPVQELVMEYLFLYLRNDGTTESNSKFVTLSVIFPLELEGLLIETGFNIENNWGSFDKQPLNTQSRRIIVVASKP